MKMKKILLYVCAMMVLMGSPFMAMASETVSVYSSSQQETQPREAFVLFYMAGCIHCRHFDPVLREYAESHHIPVLAYTLDGNSLPSFPGSLTPNKEEMTHFFPNGNPVVPSLFLMSLNDKKIVPVLQGEASQEQLDSRLRSMRSLIGGSSHD